MSLWAKSLPYTTPPCTLPFSNLYSDFEAIFGCLEITFIPRCSGDKQKQPCLSGNAETAYSQLEGTAGSHLAQSRPSLAESRLLGPRLVQFLDHFQGQTPQYLDKQFQWLAILTMKDLTGNDCRKQYNRLRNADSS